MYCCFYIGWITTNKHSACFVLKSEKKSIYYSTIFDRESEIEIVWNGPQM